jgi:hypothetical protein
MDLSRFERNASFYGSLDLLVTIKSFDLQAIRKRYLQSRARAAQGGKRTGSVERRQPSMGGVARVRLEGGRCQAEVLSRMIEPRGIDLVEDRQRRLHAAIAAENTVHWFRPDGRGRLQHPWFSYLHTVQFQSGQPEHVVVSSSGFDWIGSFDLSREGAAVEAPTRTWLAWEHGFDQGMDPASGKPYRLTRNPEMAKRWEAEGTACLLVEDPPEAAIPTARRAAFINSVAYDPMDPDALLATFFHEGAVYRIAPDGSSERLLDGLKNPHGGRRRGVGIMATSTASGEIVERDATGIRRWQFARLGGKAEGMEEREWIQNTCVVPMEADRPEVLVAIDANRTCFAVIDTVEQRLDMVPFPQDWAVQDLVPATPNAGLDAWIRSLGTTT